MRYTVQVVDGPIKAHVHIPGSKSITNRALLLAGLAEGVSEIFDMLISDDTLVFVEALMSLGIKIQLNQEKCSCIVAGGTSEYAKKDVTIWCGEAGTAARFLLAACAALPGKYQFDAGKRLRERPILPLLRALCVQGASVQPPDVKKMPFTLLGAERLRGGEIEIEGQETSQFISALLMAAPFSRAPVVIRSQSVVSSAYTDMTCNMMAEFGVMVRRMHLSEFKVLAPQRYQARDYVVEPDLSTASYFFAAAAMTGGQISIQAIDRSNCKQGDVKFLRVLEKMGCQVVEEADKFTVIGPEQLQGVKVDMSNFSDTFMTLAAIAPFAATPTTITNISHTRLQESNRISAMRDVLVQAGIKVEEGSDWLRIYPSVGHGALVHSHNDHRIAMSASLLGLRIPGIEIGPAEVVSKTCPNFFAMWKIWLVNHPELIKHGWGGSKLSDHINIL